MAKVKLKIAPKREIMREAVLFHEKNMVVQEGTPRAS
jgi:hypothetical protein